jgi:hypothetical protein
MIKRLFVICLLSVVFINVKAQTFGNEWINYSQKYYRINITQNGIYRINAATLSAAGISGVNPRYFQIFNKGVQQPIYIQGESHTSLTGTDFIEFYGEKNDGTLDSKLYVNTAFIPNPYYSLISDTAAYFLTWNSSVNNSRFLLQNSTAFTGYTPENYFFKDEVQDFHDGYYQGETDGVGGTDSRYTAAEGFFGGVFNLNGSINYSITTSNAYIAGPNARIETVVVGASKDGGVCSQPGMFDHYLTIEFTGSAPTPQTIVLDTGFCGYIPNKFIKSVPASILGAGFTNFNYSSITHPQLNSNRAAVSYIRVKYPHTFDLEGDSTFVMYIPDVIGGIGANSFVNISNFSATDTVRIYDLTSGKRIKVVQSGSNYKALIPNSINGTEKKCLITSDAHIKNISSLKPVTASAKFTNYISPLVDSAFIIVTHKSLMSGATNYKNYRSSPAGGSHHVILADIDELYDQFAYGVLKSPLAVRGLCDFLIKSDSTKIPQNLFLMGKSIHLSLCKTGTSSVSPNTPPAPAVYFYQQNLVPSFGNPSSDNLFTSGLNGLATFDIAIPTGRLAAKNNADINNYLAKVKQFDTTQVSEWKKEVLHFGGGHELYEQQSFKAYLDNYKAIIQDTAYGGHVTSYFKTSSAPIQINQSDTLRDIINNGVSMMTFFGHASGTGFDQSIDDIQSYNPIKGHYPLVLANSCYAGDLHQLDNTANGYPLSSSEVFVLTPDKGAIAYIGGVGLGVPYVLNYYSQNFIKELASLNYGKSIGSDIKKAINIIQPQALTDSLVKNVCMDMTLHGDPSIIIGSNKKPDYKITNSNVYFTFTPTDVKVFAVRTNIGRAIHDTIIDELTRIFPNGDIVKYQLQSAAPFYKDTISFTIPIDFVNGIGLNKIIISLDRYNSTDELNENNNVTGEVSLLINGGAINPVYPTQFAIIPDSVVTLKASTANPFAPAKMYRFQIDTTDQFNSGVNGMFLDDTIYAPGGIIQWVLPPSYTSKIKDSLVIFWRVSPDSTAATTGNGYFWRESSFQFIRGKHGWEQAHFFQYKDDTYQYVKYNRPQRKFDFSNDVKNIFCRNGIVPYLPWTDVIYSINGYVEDLWSYAVPGFTIAVIDPVTGLPRGNMANGDGTGQWGSVTGHPAGTIENEFEYYDNNLTSRATMANFITSSGVIHQGDYVLAYSQYKHSIPNYEGPVKAAFGSVLKSTQIPNNNVPLLRPYILFTKVGSGVPATEIIGTNANSVIEFETAITTNFSNGTITSPIIGPAQSWGSFHWRQKTLDGATTADEVIVKLYGIRTNGVQDSLYTFGIDSLDVLDLGYHVPVATYPNIRLVASMKDPLLHTPPQMKRWQVIYAPVPEAAINPAIGFAYASGNSSVMQQGTHTKIYMPIQNIGDIPFSDSLLVTYWVEDADRINHALPSKMKKPGFAPGEIIMDTIDLNSASYIGNCGLWVEVNPLHPTRAFDTTNTQLEQYHFNNIARIAFTATPDRINPLLDVTFDGVHILNNDIVSAKPNILIKLKDENKFLALNDTNDFKIFIQTPTTPLKRIYFGNTITFIPAILPNNSCKINYTPALIGDGTYQLVIEAKDRSDNQSGAIDYKISFEVINKSTITEVMNYPNPFSTSTHFVFTLTGSTVPTYFKIQIMTITGKVVREINNDELGAIHIGRNITDYAWNGKDEFGDQLANGIYLYRVVTSINGETIEKRQTDADQYFKKGFGKMYLMR